MCKYTVLLVEKQNREIHSLFYNDKLLILFQKEHNIWMPRYYYHHQNDKPLNVCLIMEYGKYSPRCRYPRINILYSNK